MKCSTNYCKNPAITGRKICHKCKSRKFKESQPASYFFNVLRLNARRRGKEFSLQLNEFKKFCVQNGYLEYKDKRSDSLSIDRINNHKGYSIDNIQILTLGSNSRKEAIRRKCGEYENVLF